MREIKFRAWSKKNNLMLYQYDTNGTTLHCKSKLTFFTNYNSQKYSWKFMEAKLFSHITQENIELNNDNSILMQFTGLKDKNRKEIYEGDIIKVYNWGLQSKDEVLHTTFIIWDKENARWDYNDFFDIDEDDRWRVIEVIGNIYENPEMVK